MVASSERCDKAEMPLVLLVGRDSSTTSLGSANNRLERPGSTPAAQPDCYTEM
jgi:hypothetical protein